MAVLHSAQRSGVDVCGAVCLECPGEQRGRGRERVLHSLVSSSIKGNLCRSLPRHWAVSFLPPGKVQYSLQVMRDGKECRSVLPVPASTTLYADLRANARCLDKLEWCFCSRNVVVTTRVNRSCRNMISAALLLSFNVCVSAPLASRVQGFILFFLWLNFF